MTTASKVTRLSQNETDKIDEILKELMESSIAKVCRKRNIFPQSAFHSSIGCTHDLDLLKFRRDESFSKDETFENESQISLSPLSWTGSLKTWVKEANSSSACPSTQIYSTPKDRQKVELQLILDWLHYEAFTNVKDFSTTKIDLHIVRSLDDAVLEEYEFTFSCSHGQQKGTGVTIMEEVKSIVEVDASSLEPADRYLLLHIEHTNKSHIEEDCTINHDAFQMSTKMGNSPIRMSPMHLEDSEKKRSSSRSIHHGKEKPRKRKKYQRTSDEPNSNSVKPNECDPILPDHTRVYAIPRLPKADKRPIHIRLPCEIIGHRYHNGTLQYKLSFDDKILDQNRIRKQWRNATRIQTKSDMIDNILGEIYGNHDVDLEDIARKLGVNVSLVQEVFEEMKKVDVSHESEEGYQNDQNGSSKFSLSQGTEREDEPQSSQNSFVYAFAISPVTVTIM